MTELSRKVKVGNKDDPKRSSSPKEILNLQLEKNAIKRIEMLRKSMLLVAISFFLFLSAILAIAIFAFSWHKLTPIEWKFLEEKQIDNIQTFLLSGALTAFLSSVGRNMVNLYHGKDSKS